MIINFGFELILFCLITSFTICFVILWFINRNRSGSLLLKSTQTNQYSKIILFLGIIQIIVGIVFGLYFLRGYLLYSKTNFQYIFSAMNLFAIVLVAIIKELSDIEIREHGIVDGLFFIKWNLIETYNWKGIYCPFGMIQWKDIKKYRYMENTLYIRSYSKWNLFPLSKINHTLLCLPNPLLH
jgi:hypothetical protein